MIEGLKPYAELRDMEQAARPSEVSIPWLTSLPKHWGIVRSKWLFTARKERANPEDEQLSATQAYGVILQKDFESRAGRKVVRITQHLEKRAHVEKDDFVISMRSFQGGLERAWEKGCIRSSYVVLKPSLAVRVDYYALLFKSLNYIRALQATSNFIRDGQDLNFGNFCLVDLPLPPKEEQAAIARFLDHANRKIDGFIRAKRKLIALLGEQKQAIIHRAVTRGLNPDVPLKSSGIPWHGDIPAHWEVMQLRQVLSFGPKNGVSPQAATGIGVLSFSISAIRNGRVTVLGNEKRVQLDSAQINGFRIDKGDILLVRGNGNISLVGKCGLVEDNYDNCVYPDIVMKIRPNNRMIAEFMVLAINSIYVSNQVSILAKTSNGAFKVSGATVSSVLMLTPPVEEQSLIMDHARNENSLTDTAIARIEREIALMQEYRTRLTADIVTGKLDVREAAAKLPELPVEAPQAGADEDVDDAAIAEDAETEDT